MTKSNTPQSTMPGSALDLLDVFVGVWNTEGQTRATPSTPSVRITGTDTYEWLPGGFFLLHRVDVCIGGQEIKTTEIIGYNASSRIYPMHYFDNQGNSGTYQASVHDCIWTFMGESERSRVVFSEDGNTITASWEHSDNGLNWLPLMEVKLTKVEDFTGHPRYTASPARNREIGACPERNMAGNYALINGLNLYYETYGTGKPLILLHGGVGAGEMFGSVLPEFSESRQVITVHLQAHGKTADIDRPLSLELMADDIAALMNHLGIGNADIMGYSLGAGVALQTVIRYPDMVRRLVFVSAPFRRDGWYPEILEGMAQMGSEASKAMTQTPLYQLYPDTDWEILFTKLGNLLRQDYDLSKDIAAIRSPVMLIFADTDAVRTEHIIEFFKLLGGGQRDAGLDGLYRPGAQLAILPGMTHYNILSFPMLAVLVTTFLDSPMPEIK